jgi:F-type H+-transporting ATPase subunit a
MSAGLHISISAETIFYLFGIPVSNSMLTSLIVSGMLIALAIFAKRVMDSAQADQPPTRWQNFLEMVVEGLYNFVDSVVHNKAKSALLTPIFGSFFLFILLNNWLGLLPGVGTIGLTHEPGHMEVVQEAHAAVEEHATGEHQEVQVEEHAEEHHVFIPIFRAGTADLNTTLSLAIVTMFIVQVLGVKFLSLGYFKKFFNFSSPIMFFVGILELVSEFAKIISFAFRLFGNVFAGEVLLAVMMFLLPLFLPMPFYGLEIFVGFIQALVFSMLSLVFYNMATISHDEH